MTSRKLQENESPGGKLSRSQLPRLTKRTLTVLLAAFVLMLGAAGVSVVFATNPGSTVTVTDPPEVASKPGPKVAPASYPITGYFISASSRDDTNSNKLSEIKALGGDTVITFGVSLLPASLETIPASCLIDGKNCARVAAGSRSINRYFTFLDGSNWGRQALKCPDDREVDSRGQSFTVLVLPNTGSGCTSPDGVYNVVVAGGSSASAIDPSKSVASAATKLGMKYFAGLPAPAKRPDAAYLPDVSYQGTLELFTERFLQYQASANDVPGLAGFYHHTEMPLTDSATFDSVLALYASQNGAIHRALPTREAIVSPYIDARVDKSGISVDEARRGIRKIAQTADGVKLNIAIQDGMGTGKGGAFSASDADSAVDPYAASIVGNGAWGSKYLAPNKDYFEAAAAGLAGTGAVLWANVEGMAPATKLNACGDNLRGQTTKSRVDRQLQQVANARKVISFMWDSYFTCKGAGVPLKNQLQAGLTTPIITDATFSPATGKVQVVGFNLEGSTATVKWSGDKGQKVEKSVKSTALDSKYGVKKGMNPQLEMITVNVGPTSVGKTKIFSVKVTNSWGAKATEFNSLLS
ncbi:hypothetical protein LRQ04_01825 [Paenarthrobacter sp. AR 02]|uniref:hypothetical protein n=1 Tax=Paenarthrobacter sp. AR 02 TaxID=2899821 RepID=UPI001F3469E1|nr:hypothetical protein [Paenarthrobacter sp. AR 02]MCF3137981.1 hypothetical protein [Paenarthrobacter sp. AR 02]